MMEVDSSVIIMIHERIAPEITPDIIIGTVTLKKVLKSDAPRLMEASSMLGEMLRRIAEEERIVYGIRRIVYERIIMNAPPVSSSGFLLNVVSSAMPRMEPMTVSGNMETTSIAALNTLRRRTTT